MAKLRGVNLGGWFVLERWMTPELFEGVSGPDETVFCKEANNAKEKLEKHWDSFISEEDFRNIKELGLNSVRIPIPWWSFVETKPYYQSTIYIKRALEWAEKYQLKVLLDLHTAPGCQNGFDNGGITGVIDWPKKVENIDLTVKVLGDITKIFMPYKALWGIEVLNEPHFSIDINLIQDFYLRAYQEIRKYSKTINIVFHDAFRPQDESWRKFFIENKLKDVYFDLHLYQCFDPKYNDFNLTDHVNEALKRENLIKSISEFVPVIVGEWSLGLHQQVLNYFDRFNEDNALRLYGAAQLYAYEKGYGWYFWSYKLDIKHQSGWFFKKLVEAGIFPNQYK